MKDSPKILEVVYWTTRHFVREGNGINIHNHENFRSHIDVILSVVVNIVIIIRPY
jgi:hypothetical protein